MKKLAKLLITVLLLCCMTTSALAWNLEGSIFPLEEPVTFTVLTSGYRSGTLEDLEKNKDWQALLAETNVNFEFVFLGDYDSEEARTNLQTRLMGGDYGDAIMSVYLDTLSLTDIQDLASAQMIVPLTEYMTNPEIMPNFAEVLENSPTMLTNYKSLDGQAYYMAGLSEINAYTAGEGMMMVNVAWMEQWQQARGITHSPKTLEEFEDMLCYFRDNDMNGNGKTDDEIPYFMAQGTFMGCATVEHALGMYGIATKDSTADMNIMIGDDGQVFYAHTTDAYKEGLKTLASWYEKDLIWEEVFTANAETITNVMNDASNNVGVYNACEDLGGYFETILPPAIEGYNARYHMHPSTRVGVRQHFAVITDKCENPEVLASFLDLLMNFDNYLTWTYGSKAIELGSVTKMEDGTYVFNNKALEGVELAEEDKAINGRLETMQVNTLHNFENVDTESYFGDSARVRGYLLYEENGIWNPTANLWPRCTLLEDYATDYAFMYTDVSATLAEYRAKFVTGELDVDEKWDEFQQKLQKLGIEEMRDIIQETYDAYLNK